jgi:hypothetical protein
VLLAVPMPRSRPTRTAIPRSRPLLVLTAPPPCGKKATRPEQADQKARQQLDEMSPNANDEQNHFFCMGRLVASSGCKAARGGQCVQSQAQLQAQLARGWLV